MIKKLILLAAILLPFALYYLSVVIIKKDTNKKLPVIPLSLASIVLLAGVLIFFRFTDTVHQMENMFRLNLKMEKLYPQRLVRFKKLTYKHCL